MGLDWVGLNGKNSIITYFELLISGKEVKAKARCTVQYSTILYLRARSHLQMGALTEKSHPELHDTD
jgi:hypothetical protein